MNVQWYQMRAVPDRTAYVSCGERAASAASYNEQKTLNDGWRCFSPIRRRRSLISMHGDLTSLQESTRTWLVRTSLAFYTCTSLNFRLHWIRGIRQTVSVVGRSRLLPQRPGIHRQMVCGKHTCSQRAKTKLLNIWICKGTISWSIAFSISYMSYDLITLFKGGC